MNLIEFIGFVISLVAMTILFFSRMIEKKRRALNPKLYDEMEQRKEQKLKEFMRSLHVQHDNGFDDDDDDEDDDEDDEGGEDDYVRLPPRIASQQTKSRFLRPVIAARTPAADGPVSHPAKYEPQKIESSYEKWRLNSSIKDSYQDRFLKQPGGDALHEKSLHLDPYALKKESSGNRILRLIAGLDSPKDMIVLQAVIGPPKAFSRNTSDTGTLENQ